LGFQKWQADVATSAYGGGYCCKRLSWVAIEIFQDHWRKADILIARAQVRKWHLALFRCDAELVRYRRMLDIE
jgi:hypothetical protein